MMTRTRRLASMSATAFAGALALAPVLAMADAYTPPAADSRAVELFKHKHDKKTNYEVPGSKYKFGRAEIFINAPLSSVRGAVLDYASYSSFIEKFQKSKVLKKEGTAAEVYLQIPILHGAATIWSVEKFAAPVVEGKGEKVVGTMVKGNVDDLRAVWSYRPVDDKHTVLTLDLYIAPKLPVPASLVTHEVEDASGDGVRAVRDRAEAAVRLVATATP